MANRKKGHRHRYANTVYRGNGPAVGRKCACGMVKPFRGYSKGKPRNGWREGVVVLNYRCKNPLDPLPSLLCKVGSMIVHVKEARSKQGHPYDWMALDSLLADDEVVSWLDAMGKIGLLPKVR